MDIVKSFLEELISYKSICGVPIETDIDNNKIIVKTDDGVSDTIRVSTLNGENIILSSNSTNEEATVSKEVDIDELEKYFERLNISYDIMLAENSNSETDLLEDEVDEHTSNSSPAYETADIQRITSDLSKVVVSKLMCNDTLVGYRFRTNNGCLDISIEMGTHLGIVPYKICKRVNLQEVDGVLVSNFEKKNHVLFPDISNNEELCRKMLKAVLS